MSKHEVKGELRYRHDIFLLIGISKESRRLFVDELRERSGWGVKCKCSGSWVDMLDVAV